MQLLDWIAGKTSSVGRLILLSALGGVLAAAMAAYNIAAWCYRRETHLGINAVVYTLAVIWEA